MLRPFTIALAASLGLGPLVLAVIRNRLVDVPNRRSSHTMPTPRGGGLSIIGGICLAIAFAGVPVDRAVWAVVVASILLAGVGLIDDVGDLPALARLAAQFVVGGAGVTVALAAAREDVAWAVVPLAVFFVAGYTNAFNFMDGINGIAGAQLLVAGGAWWAAGAVTGQAPFELAGAIGAGAAIGYLPWNFPKARFFMGDVGSYFVGMWLAGNAVVGAALDVPILVVLAPLALFGIDTAFTLAIRVARREPWLSAHRSHVYQRLSDRLGQTTTTIGYTAASIVIAAGTMTLLQDAAVLKAVGLVGAGLLAAVYPALPRMFGLPWLPPRSDADRGA
jgi:UDP-N-acetylmuramyl pentapeptide phosphotransferase/UDP-N-acetylglucosamine-1-phosphate transferase